MLESDISCMFGDIFKVSADQSAIYLFCIFSINL